MNQNYDGCLINENRSQSLLNSPHKKDRMTSTVNKYKKMVDIMEFC